MAIIHDEVRPGDKWQTYGPIEGYSGSIEGFCEAPRHAGQERPGYSFQVFTRNGEMVATWITCQDCDEMMNAQVQEIQEGGNNAPSAE